MYVILNSLFHLFWTKCDQICCDKLCFLEVYPQKHFPKTSLYLFVKKTFTKLKKIAKRKIPIIMVEKLKFCKNNDPFSQFAWFFITCLPLETYNNNIKITKLLYIFFFQSETLDESFQLFKKFFLFIKCSKTLFSAVYEYVIKDVYECC